MLNRLLLLCCVILIQKSIVAQSDSLFILQNYQKFEYQIPMRDGVKLFTSVYVPKDGSKKYPIMLNRTPYSVKPYGVDKYKTVLGPSSNFVKEGFIFVYQDVRGKYLSEGEFVDVRPHNTNKKGKQIDEASDTFDTIDWLINNLKSNNGKVGVWGISYPGFYSSMAALSNHPALKAVSPQAPVTNWFIGDDFHHNGAFFVFDALSFYSSFGKKRPQPTTESANGLSYDGADAYEFYLKLGALKNINERYLKNEIPFWNELMAHPDYDDFWKARDARQYLKGVKPAMLTVGGFFDAEDTWGALETYKALEIQNPGLDNKLVMGPWFHGGWARGKGDYFGDIKFGSATSVYHQDSLEFPFFMQYLKDAPAAKLAEANVFDIGADKWNAFETWPPKNLQSKTLYFRSNGRLTFESPSESDARDEYISDPNKPVPFENVVSKNRSREYMIADQRFAAKRPDVLVYSTEELKEDITIAGPLTADLFVAITGTDADFVVKLIDVYPDTAVDVTINDKKTSNAGYQMLVRGEIMRGKYRNSLEKPEVFVPNEPTEVKYNMPDVMHTFKKGHKIMVQVQSSWFPLVDRNPQQFMNIHEANDDDFIKAKHTVYREKNLPSNLKFGVLSK